MTKPENHPEDLLPWVANGTLAGKELADVERHLAGCPRCREELELLRALRRGIKSVGNAEVPGELARARLLRDVKRATSKSNNWWQPALAAAITVIVLQTALLVGLWPREESITPLGAPPARGVVLQIRFAPQATEAQMRSALQSVNGSIIEGPGALGVYRVRVDTSETEKNEHAAKVVSELQSLKQIVSFVEREP